MKGHYVKYLVFGADGMLGGALSDRLGAECQRIVGPPHKTKRHEDLVADITSKESVFELVKRFRPRVVINAAAYADVDGCETNFDRAFDVNGYAVGSIAEACREEGAKLVQISTDYVFDGEKRTPYLETDHPNPISRYGRSKLEGEEQAKKAKDFLIVRTAWLYGKFGKNFVTAILKNAKENGSLSVVDDQAGSPTCTIDLSAGIIRLLDSGAHGIYNLTNSGSCSWFEYSRMILELSGITGVRVTPITTKESNRAAHRPAYSILDTSKYEKLTGSKMRPWQDALKDYILHK